METSQQQRRPTIGQLATRLNQAALDVDATDLADILWLAQFIALKAEIPAVPTNSEVSKSKTVPSQSTETDPKSSSTTPTETLNLYADPPKIPTQTQSEDTQSQEDKTEVDRPLGTPFPTPAAPALRTRLDLARSLKPLMRKVPSRIRFELDEEATVSQYAETRMLLPIVQPQAERWLDLNLVVENSKTTILWQRAILELEKLLQYQGAFRTLRTWSLAAEDQHIRLFPRWNRPREDTNHQQRSKPRNPKEITDPRGRRLILLVSDCTSTLWRRGLIHETLWQWAEVQPIAMVQLLPERLWSRTALTDGHRVKLSALVPGLASSQLTIHGLPHFGDWNEDWNFDDEFDASFSQPRDRRLLTLPILTLEPVSLKVWAKVLAGVGDFQTPGRTFELAFIQELASECANLPPPEPRTAQQRVALFQATASPLAQKLVGLMAAVPVSLPVIDLLRDEFLPDAQQAHVAEVLLSGLLVRNDQEEEGQCRYTFFGDQATEASDRVRNLMLDTVPEAKAVNVLNRLSQIIASKAGYSISTFEAFLALWQGSPERFGTSALPFAQVGLDTLRRLGGACTIIAEQYAWKGQRTGISRQKGSTVGDFPLDDLEYEVAKLVNSGGSPPLESMQK